ncbi:hypothetical protein GMC59_06580 [Turicibacter sanguinis]|nr:hypothetical protein [Turicibacter sanguinis]MTO78091.1 hypothetical protein [Turicibacter sanguinis]
MAVKEFKKEFISVCKNSKRKHKKQHTHPKENKVIKLKEFVRLSRTPVT